LLIAASALFARIPCCDDYLWGKGDAMGTAPKIAAGLLLALLAAGTAAAQQQPAAAMRADEPADRRSLSDLLWIARPLVVFADSASDPRFAQQIDLLEERMPELVERDVVVLTDTEPEARGPLRRDLRPRGFGIVLIDKDGSVAKRNPAPTTARELINLIDRMPSRRQETGSLRQ
jgi:Domain of unknown function (DUF4174)